MVPATDRGGSALDRRRPCRPCMPTSAPRLRAQLARAGAPRAVRPVLVLGAVAASRLELRGKRGRVDRDDYRFALMAHLDFVVAHAETEEPLFALEFDGDERHRTDLTTVLRDDRKRRLCREFDLPLLRIDPGFLRCVNGDLAVCSLVADEWLSPVRLGRAGRRIRMGHRLPPRTWGIKLGISTTRHASYGCSSGPSPSLALGTRSSKTTSTRSMRLPSWRKERALSSVMPDAGHAVGSCGPDPPLERWPCSMPPNNCGKWPPTTGTPRRSAA